MNINVVIKHMDHPHKPWRMAIFVDGDSISETPARYRTFRDLQQFYQEQVACLADDDTEIRVLLWPDPKATATIRLNTEEDWALAVLTYK